MDASSPPRLPAALRAGSRVAVLSPAWGGPARYPHVFDAGLAVLRDDLGLEPVEYPTTRAEPEDLEQNPTARARDFMAAMTDSSIDAIIASIGGEDSIRILPALDASAIAANPKIVMGYSDITTLLLYMRRCGVVAYHGPAVMAGFAQAPSLPKEFLPHVRSVLFDAQAAQYEPYPWWTQKYPPWDGDPAQASAVGTKYTRHQGFKPVAGSGVVRGEVLGGCYDVMTFLVGTPYFPTPDEFDGKFLLLETSEEVPLPPMVRRFLWNLGVQGTLEKICGVILGRPRGYRPDQAALLEQLVAETAAEFAKRDVPVLANVDVGHTDPQFIVPFGVPVEVDFDAATMKLTGPAVG